MQLRIRFRKLQAYDGGVYHRRHDLAAESPTHLPKGQPQAASSVARLDQVCNISADLTLLIMEAAVNGTHAQMWVPLRVKEIMEGSRATECMICSDALRGRGEMGNVSDDHELELFAVVVVAARHGVGLPLRIHPRLSKLLVWERKCLEMLFEILSDDTRV